MLIWYGSHFSEGKKVKFKAQEPFRWNSQLLKLFVGRGEGDRKMTYQVRT